VKLLLFDIDQTLINTGGAGLRALDRACFQLFGIPDAMQGISPHGKTDPAIAREILRARVRRDGAETNGEISSILEAYLSFLKDEVRASAKYRVLPGITTLLDRIVSKKMSCLGWQREISKWALASSWSAES